MLRQSQHIETVGGDVMGCRAEGKEPEKCKRQPQEIVGRANHNYAPDYQTDARRGLARRQQVNRSGCPDDPGPDCRNDRENSHDDKCECDNDDTVTVHGATSSVGW